MDCAQETIAETLRRTPFDAVFTIDEPFSSTSIAIGRNSHAAADEIDRLHAELAKCRGRENDLAEVLARVNDLLEIEASTWNVQLRIGKDLSRVLAARKGKGE